MTTARCAPTVMTLALAGVLVACKGNDPAPTPHQVPVQASPVAEAKPPEPELSIRCAPAMPAPTPGVVTATGRVGRDGRRRAQGFGVINVAPRGGSHGPAGKVRFGALKVTGSLSKATVARTLRQQHRRLAYCYEQRLVKQPNLAGAVELVMRISPDGHVQETHVASGFDQELSLCIKHMLADLPFPPPPKSDEVHATQRLTFAWYPPARVSEDLSALEPIPEPAAWTPFAATTAAVPAGVLDPIAIAFQRVIPRDKVAACYGDRSGSLRSIVRLAVDGSVIGARTGGLGDGAAERCISSALVGLRGEPVGLISELSCDIVHGAPTPWRVTPEAGYTVIDTAAPLDRAAEPSDPSASFLVLADPDTSVETLAAALRTTAVGAATLVALRADAGAPLLVASGPRSVDIADPSAPLTLDAGEPLGICGGLLDTTQHDTFAGADKLLAAAKRSCTHQPCPSALTITLATARTAHDLAALAGAARGAGFTRIQFAHGACPRQRSR